MPIVPSGQPIWLRASDFTTYGGHAEKVNHYGVGAIDALTDVDAAEFSRLTADMAAVANTAPAWIITYLCNDSVPAAPTIESVFSMFGNRLTSYAGGSPPSGFPGATRVGTGEVVFTFAASYADPYGVSGAFTIKNPHASLTGAVSGDAVCSIVGQTLTVRASTSAGAVFSNARVVLSMHSG